MYLYADSYGITRAGIIRLRVRSTCGSNVSQKLSGKYGGVLLNPVMTDYLYLEGSCVGSCFHRWEVVRVQKCNIVEDMMFRRIF